MGGESEHGFHPFEVSPAHLVYVGLGFFIVIYASLSLFIKEKLYLGEAPLAAIFGIIVGPAAINLFDPSHWAENTTRAPGGMITNEITLEVMRVTIALSVFAVGVELPRKYLLRHWKSIMFLLGPVMVWGWLVTAAFIYLLIPGLDFLNSLVVAACVTPTDPILAQAVIGGPWAEKHVPAHLRHMLACESGCNDGAAFPFLYLALYLSLNRENTRYAIGRWFYESWLYEIIFGTILGALIGWVARKALRFSERHRLIDRESFVAQYVSLAIASMGVNVLLGSDDLLAAFACGTAFAWDGWFTRQTEDSNFSNIVDLLFNCAAFIYIGALMPFGAWVDTASTLSLWRLFVLAIAVLLLKRIPIIIALWKLIPDIKTFREALFAGHFGPIGVGAIFIATLGRTELPEEVNDPPQNSNDVLALTIQPIVFFFVLCSIAVHGLTIPFFAFSKGAHKITRTWSRHPSLAPNGEPSWMTRVRRFGTKDSTALRDSDTGGGMAEIQRILASTRAAIGKSGDDGENEKAQDDVDETASPSAASGAASNSDNSDEITESRRRADVDLEKGHPAQPSSNGPSRPHTPRQHVMFVSKAEQDRAALGLEEAKEAVDDVEDWEPMEHYDPTCDWCGDNTKEMRLYKRALAQARDAHQKRLLKKDIPSHDEQQRQRTPTTSRPHSRSEERHAYDREHQEEADLGEAPMDREMITGEVSEDEEDEAVRKDKEGHPRGDKPGGSSQKRDECSADARHRRWEERQAELDEACEDTNDNEDAYPRVRQWVEGHKLVLEYELSRTSDAQVEVIDLLDDERQRISDAENPSHLWKLEHEKELDLLLPDLRHRDWDYTNSARNLIRHHIPSLLKEARIKAKKQAEKLKEKERRRASGEVTSGSETETEGAAAKKRRSRASSAGSSKGAAFQRPGPGSRTTSDTVGGVISSATAKLKSKLGLGSSAEREEGADEVVPDIGAAEPQEPPLRPPARGQSSSTSVKKQDWAEHGDGADY
ncbi:hypothetical protein OC845_001201 [Tilletia horrida]|nr:hypothetical protein OC845_001201 [Tilletia horrida]